MYTADLLKEKLTALYTKFGYEMPEDLTLAYKQVSGVQSFQFINNEEVTIEEMFENAETEEDKEYVYNSLIRLLPHGAKGIEYDDSEEEPTTEPTVEPVVEPTVKPEEPVVEPTVKPEEPTDEPVVEPTVKPEEPTDEPKEEPTVQPEEPVEEPIEEPTDETEEPKVTAEEVESHIGDEVTDETKKFDLDNDGDIDGDDVAKASSIEIEEK